MIAFSYQILLVFSLYDLSCIILTTGKQIIAFEKGTFAPPTERQEGRLLPPAPFLRRAWDIVWITERKDRTGERKTPLLFGTLLVEFIYRAVFE